MSWDIVDFCPSRVWYRTFQNLRFSVFGGGHFMRTFNCSRNYIMKLFTWMAQVFKWVFQFLIWFIQYIRYGMFQYFEFTKWGPFQVSKQKKTCRFLVKSLKMSESYHLKHTAWKVSKYGVFPLVRIQKNTGQKKTPYLDTFYAVTKTRYRKSRLLRLARVYMHYMIFTF